VIKSAALLAEDFILPDHLPIHLRAASPVANGERDDRTRLHLEVGVEVADTMDLKIFRTSVADAAEKELITRVTQVDRNKQFELAAFLNIDPKTLRSKLKRYGLSQEEQVHGGKDPGSRRSG
jgi:DNA-binding NtrC family response regulator